MDEMKKLAEAKYFYEKMEEQLDNSEKFKHYFSAFLAASRSVLYYALGEVGSKKNSKNQAWHDRWVSNSALFEFFTKNAISIFT